MYDLIIIGGGPAGLTATVYAIHKRLETLLITEDLGGKANYRMHIRGLEGYETINGEEVIRKFQSQVEYLDFARLMDQVVVSGGAAQQRWPRGVPGDYRERHVVRGPRPRPGHRRPAAHAQPA